MSYILATYRVNWADEMYLYDLVIMPQNKWEDFLKMAAHPIYPFDMSVGTNEYVTFCDTNDVMPQTLKVLTDEEGKMFLEKLVRWKGEDTFTLGNVFDRIYDKMFYEYDELIGEPDETE